MNTIPLPALEGRLPLGFLAACGVLRLLSDEANEDVRLSWDPSSGVARLHVDASLDDVVERLQSVVANLEPSVTLPGGPAGFPASESPKEWPRGDPMRMPVLCFRDQIEHWRSEYSTKFVDMWVPGMVTDLAVDEKDCVDLTPFAAPSGKQQFSTMFGASAQRVRQSPVLIREALVGWKRYPGVSGEYLDHHVLQSAADTSAGESQEAGVPGATWLALMALPWFPAWGAGKSTPKRSQSKSGDSPSSRSGAGGWQVVQGSRRRVVAWPLWSASLDPDSVLALISHPFLRAREAPSGDLIFGLDKLAPYSVFAVRAAERRRVADRKFAGVLTPVSATGVAK